MGRGFHGPASLGSLSSASASRGESWGNLRLPGASGAEPCYGNYTSGSAPGNTQEEESGFNLHGLQIFTWRTGKEQRKTRQGKTQRGGRARGGQREKT